MNKRLCLALALLVCGVLLAVNAATNSPPPARSVGAPVKATPGVEAAQALSTITGVAISPLLGVSAVGAWRYLHTPEEKRARLPWFAQPWFWIPALVLVGIVAAKDVMGPALPTTLKKPFDVAEVFENKISALVAAGAFVPIIAAIFGSMSGEECMLGGTLLAMVDPAALLNVVTVPVAVFVFLVVWMASHVINVLILISPFATVDAGLKTVRLFLLGTVAMAGFANPYAGAAWSLVIFLSAYLLAGWSFRLTVFGTIFAWDLLTLRQKWFAPKLGANWMFTARKLHQVPVRTWGKLVRDETGQLALKYRPLLLLKAQTLALPPGQYVAGCGLVYPVLIRVEGDKDKTILTLPPRYRTHEAELARIYGLAGVRDVGIMKGFKAVWGWLKELCGWGSRPSAVRAAMVQS